MPGQATHPSGETPEGAASPQKAEAAEETKNNAAPTPEQHTGNTTVNDQHPDLTVEDILAAAHTEEALVADEENTTEQHNYLEDLRRITAEYANYRKRTEANAAREKQRAIAAVVTPLLGVLDDLDRAEKHGDLQEGGAFAAIAQKIRATLERFGVESFGETGECFDPQQHEAVAQVPVPGTQQHTILDVIEQGYRIGEVELRPAKVAVAVSADG